MNSIGREGYFSCAAAAQDIDTNNRAMSLRTGCSIHFICHLLWFALSEAA
jgi:hypothetical protein